MHLNVFVKLKKPRNTLSSGQKIPKNPKKTKKPKKNQKNPPGCVFLKKPGFFPPWNGPGSESKSKAGSASASNAKFRRLKMKLCGASKIKLKKVNKKRTVTVRRIIIFLNISRHPLLICLQCCLHQYRTLKAVTTVTAAIVLLTPAKNLKAFLGFLVVVAASPQAI